MTANLIYLTQNSQFSQVKNNLSTKQNHNFDFMLDRSKLLSGFLFDKAVKI
jgi:hypothetical protein